MTLIQRLRNRMLIQHGGPNRPNCGWNLSIPDSQMHREAADELQRFEGETAVLVRLLLECDKVLSTLEGEEDEDQRLIALRQMIMAATVPHRPEEADLLSLRACLGA